MQCSKQMERGNKGCKVSDVVGREGVSYMASEDEQEDYNVVNNRIIDANGICNAGAVSFEKITTWRVFVSVRSRAQKATCAIYAGSRIQRESPTIVAPVHFRTAHLNYPNSCCRQQERSKTSTTPHNEPGYCYHSKSMINTRPLLLYSPKLLMCNSDWCCRSTLMVLPEYTDGVAGVH